MHFPSRRNGCTGFLPGTQGLPFGNGLRFQQFPTASGYRERPGTPASLGKSLEGVSAGVPLGPLAASSAGFLPVPGLLPAPSQLCLRAPQDRPCCDIWV